MGILPLSNNFTGSAKFAKGVFSLCLRSPDSRQTESNKAAVNNSAEQAFELRLFAMERS